jgi:hypothetical protein
VPSPPSITSDTPTNLVIGAGNVYRNQLGFGASVDDNTFRIEREIFTPDLNGLKGALVGTDYITRSEGMLECTLPEVSATSLSAGWPGSQSTTDDGVTTIDETDARRIPTAAYADWELQVERLGGGEFQFEVDNAIQIGNYEATLTDDGLYAPRYSLASRWDPADVTVSPHRIRILTAAS